jgi:hypothetical protein
LMGTPWKHIGDNKKTPLPMSDGHLWVHIEPSNYLPENCIPKIVCQWCANIFFTQMYSLGMDRMDLFTLMYFLQNQHLKNYTLVITLNTCTQSWICFNISVLKNSQYDVSYKFNLIY